MNFTTEQLEKFRPKDGHSLVLKSVCANMASDHTPNFVYPESGHVEAPDWKPTHECGNGLHGWLWGEGDARLRSSDKGCKWLVLSVETDAIINLNDKVKFQGGTVVFAGSREMAVEIICHFAPAGSKVIFSTLTGGDDCTLTGGGYCTLTGGDDCTLTGGDHSTLTGGDYCTLTGGDYCTLTGGDDCTLTGGEMAALIFNKWDWKNRKRVRRIALVDGVNYMPGLKYTLNNNFEIVEVKNEE